MYNIEERKALLKGISIDSISGIQTMVDNLNKSPNINFKTVVFTPKEENTTSVEEVIIKNEIKPLQITILEDAKINKLSQYIDNLPEKNKRKLIFGLFALTITLLIIAIIK